MGDPDTEVLPGQVLAGKYKIEQVLGKGGMGVVTAAMHLQLQERVALKFLLPEALANPEAVRRFEREARAAVKIKSEHVARVTDVGVLETGAPYMVMEYLSGLDLGQYLESYGVLEPSEAVEYLLQACEAVAEAHSLGIVHRDLKPANLFRILRADGTPSIKVLDFGISKVAADHSLTQTSSMMGSPYYMSPEQMTSAKSVDARSDIWSLGVILHELLTGRTPYEGDTVPEICVQILHEPPPKLTALRPDLSPGLEKVVARALEKDRANRYPDIAALATDLAPFASERSRHSVERVSRVLGTAPTTVQGDRGSASAGRRSTDTVAVPAADSPIKETLAGAANTQPEGSGSRSRWGGIAVAGVLLVGAVGAAAVAITDGQEEELAEPAAEIDGEESPRARQAERESPGEDDPRQSDSSEKRTDDSEDAGSGQDDSPAAAHAPPPTGESTERAVGAQEASAAERAPSSSSPSSSSQNSARAAVGAQETATADVKTSLSERNSQSPPAATREKGDVAEPEKTAPRAVKSASQEPKARPKPKPQDQGKKSDPSDLFRYRK